VDRVQAPYRIGELSRLSGLSVKTIRFYSDRGLVPPAGRTDGGYRVYDDEALARLELVRALRELGASLAQVEGVLRKAIDLPALVALQLEAVEAQLRVLRVRRAVLRAIAAGGRDKEELRTIARLAQLSDEERRRMVEDFLDEVLAGLEVDPGLAARLRGGLPALPDDPTPEHVEASGRAGRAGARPRLPRPYQANGGGRSRQARAGGVARRRRDARGGSPRRGARRGGRGSRRRAWLGGGGGDRGAHRRRVRR
jgi:DNA-binding transcriptional MerR regulator